MKSCLGQYVSDEKSVRHATAKTRGEAKVDVNELLEFIFPSSLQHPLSTGRLYAFAMHGPLDENANLRAGRGGKRIVSPREIDSMCLQFERDDILRVYISSRRPLFVLSEAQKEEVIAQADIRLKTGKGRGYGRQVTRAGVIQLLAGLPRDESNMVSFHDAQRVIINYREEQIDRFRLVFPDLVCRKNRDEKSSSSSVKASSATNATPQQGSSAVVSRGSQGSRPDGKKKTPAVGTRTPAEGDSPMECGAGVQRGRGKIAHKKFSPDVAPADMFVKDVGYTPAGLANHTNKLLSTRVFKVCHIDDGNNPGLAQNVTLIRDDEPLDHLGGQKAQAWDRYSCLRGKNVGARVRSARSTTTFTRKA